MLLAAACAGGALDGFERAEVTVAGRVWAVAVADEPSERERGLSGVTDLGDLAGMLFVFPHDTTAGFWMQDTLLSLDIAFFDAEGSLVDLLSMTPCPGEDCPTYRAAGPYRFALEVPAGGFGGVEDLRLDPASVGG